MNEKWDNYYLDVCNAVAKNSSCLSRKIGAILVKDKSIISTGYNGAPRGHYHCGKERLLKDERLVEELSISDDHPRLDVFNTCPRRLLGYGSGEGLQWCPAEHAERNCIADAARRGVKTKGSTLYMNTGMPCQNCMTLLINAGIVEFVLSGAHFYDELSKDLYKTSGIKARLFLSDCIIGV